MCMIGNFVELRLFINFQPYVCPKSEDHNINVNVDIVGLSCLTEHKTSASIFKAYDVLIDESNQFMYKLGLLKYFTRS